MAVRQKQKVLDTAYTHFKEFGLPLDIEYKSYVNIVGPKEALHVISIKRSFKAWKYLLHALRIKHPDLREKAPAPKPTTPKPAPKPKAAPSKPAKAEAKSED
jgi:hypothetical protein